MIEFYYFNMRGKWKLFTSYNWETLMLYGFDEARKTLGIDVWALYYVNREAIIACSRLTEAQTRALYAAIGRAETEAA